MGSPVIKIFCKLAVVSGAASLMLACGGGSTTPTIKPPQLPVNVSPAAFTMGVGSNMTFTATVTGSTNQNVTWQVNQVTGGNSSVGTIDSTGLYIAPVNMPPGPVRVTAIAQADGVSQGSAAVTIAATDPAGTAQATSIPCPTDPKNVPGSCYSVVLSCPGVADFTGYAKVTSPAGTPVGTIMLTGGGNGTGMYEDYTFGDTTVNNVVAAGFTAVQTSFGGPFTDKTPQGWQTGPGGIRRLACRYATLANWVYSTIQNDNTKPLCATGNSAGGQLISETLAHYGTDSIFSMVEPTSGPPFSDMEKACICGSDAGPIQGACGTTVDQCLAVKDAQNYVDPAYSAPICSQSLSTHSTANQAQFISDTIQSPDAVLNYPHTFLNSVFGGKDTSSAVTLGPDYMSHIISTKGMACVADAPHSVADVLDGAQQVANDLITGCHLY